VQGAGRNDPYLEELAALVSDVQRRTVDRCAAGTANAAHE
jgi:hypothetical protein